VEKDGSRLCFREEEEKEEEDRGGHPEEFPLRPEHGSSQHRAKGKAESTKRKDVPSPVLRIDGKPRKKRSESWSSESRCCPES